MLLSFRTIGFRGLLLLLLLGFSVNRTLTCKLTGGYFPVPPSSLRHNFSTCSPNWETIPSIIKQSESHFPLQQKGARVWTEENTHSSLSVSQISESEERWSSRHNELMKESKVEIQEKTCNDLLDSRFDFLLCYM